MKKDNKVKEVTDTPWNPLSPLSRTSLTGLLMRKREKEIVFCRAIRLRRLLPFPGPSLLHAFQDRLQGILGFVDCRGNRK